MTLEEALASGALPAFVVYDTITASSSADCPLHNAGSVGALGGAFLQDPKAEGGGDASTVQVIRRKRRRRQRSCKNKEEAENQRMTHIAVERNRRRLMNEHLAALRSLMPESYIQRGDQASVVGGAIDFVKELEQLLQRLEVQKRSTPQQQNKLESNIESNEHEPPFAHFFAYPQYTWCHTQSENQAPAAPAMQISEPVADIEVTLIETHANLRILTRGRPRQLLRMVAGLQTLRLSILHLNVTSTEAMVLYSISVKVEEGSNLSTVDDIAAAVHHLLTLLEAEVATSSLV